MNATTEHTNETSVEPAASRPAWNLLIRSPRSAIASAPPAGAKRAIHAAAITSASQRGQLVHVEVDALARDRDDQPEPDDRLRGRDHHDGQREDLAVPVAGVAREGEEREVAGVQHD